MKRYLVVLAFVAGLVGVIMACSSPPPLVDCQAKLGVIACNGQCVTPNSDTENCGSCGHVCAPGQACIHGECGTACPGGDLLCTADGGATTCVSSKTDNHNCGACGHACNGNEICFNGTCSGTCGDKQTGQTTCTPEGGAAYCANLSNDRNNCGGCGTACNAAEVCSAGKCSATCEANQQICDNGSGPFCTDITTDNGNCGGCGNVCNSTNLEVCSAGVCGSACNALQTMCTPDGGAPYCVNTKTDNKNCGGCGKVCGSNKPFCASGACSATAPQGLVYYTDNSTKGITFAKCGSGVYTNCTSTNAVAACTAISKKLAVYENINGASGVTAISTASYVDDYSTVGYYVNNDASLNGQCLVTVQAIAGDYCGYGWNGAVEVIPSTTGQQFGNIYNYDQGYQSAFVNKVDSYMYCTSSYAAYNSSCSTYYVACL